MKDRLSWLALLGILGTASSPLAAQSLGDLAQKEKEKRASARGAASPTKVYGEKDLATYAEDRPADEASAEGTPAAMSATPKTDPAKKASPASPAPKAEGREAEERRSAEDKKADTEDVRARWRQARQRVTTAEQRLAASEEEMKTLPPGLPAGNYFEDIRAAVEQQKVEREYRNQQAKKELAAAKDALDVVETEARRKQIRVD